MTATDPAPLPPPPPLPLSVLLRHKEVMASALESRSRGQGGVAWFSMVLFGLLSGAIWVGHLASFWLAQQLPFSVMFVLAPYLPVAVSAVLCLVGVSVALRMEQARAERRYLAHLTARGSPLERTGTYSVTAEALVLETDRMVLAPRWKAIDAVEKSRYGWVISADQLHFLVPFAAFPDEATQRPLLAAIVDRMSGDARARSRDAVDFASGTALGPDETREPETPANEPASDRAEVAVDRVARGWLTQEQAHWAAGVIYNRIARAPLHRWLYPLTAAVTGLIVGVFVASVLVLFVSREFVGHHPALTAAIGLGIPWLGGALGFVLGHRRLGVVLEKSWRAGLAARDVPDQVEAAWRLTPTGIAYSTPRFSGEATYASLHEVLRSGPYTIVACDILTLCIPDPAFASDDDRRAFVGALLGRIGPQARDRSARIEP